MTIDQLPVERDQPIINPEAELDMTQVQDTRPTWEDCMIVADGIVSYGWDATDAQLACFTDELDPAIVDAYGDLEAKAGTGSYTNPQPGYATCADDSGSNPPCYWDAAYQGNGQGTSFWAEADGSFRYAS